MQLHTPRRLTGKGKIYCGPTALCAVSGWYYEDIRTVINTIRMRRDSTGIIGLPVSVLHKAIKQIFGTTHEIKYFNHTLGNGNETFNQWINTYKASKVYANPNVTMILHLTHHYVTVSEDMFIDNHTLRPVHLKEAPFKKKRVKGVFKLIKNV